MLKIEIIALGNLKEKYWVDAVSEYRKRLSRYCNLTITEIKESPIPDNASQVLIDQALMKEAEMILKKIKPTDYVIALAIKGKQFDSETFASEINKFEALGKKIVFIIGSSHGLSKIMYNRAQIEISFSKMTFPHQMIRLIFLEQLYRGYKINNNEKYHK